MIIFSSESIVAGAGKISTNYSGYVGCTTQLIQVANVHAAPGN